MKPLLPEKLNLFECDFQEDGTIEQRWHIVGQEKLVVSYIRSDLVDRLKEYSEHERHGKTCELLLGNDCTCGLTDLLKELE